MFSSISSTFSSCFPSLTNCLPPPSFNRFSSSSTSARMVLSFLMSNEVSFFDRDTEGEDNITVEKARSASSNRDIELSLLMVKPAKESDVDVSARGANT